MIKLIASTMEDNVSTRMTKGGKRNKTSCVYYSERVEPDHLVRKAETAGQGTDTIQPRQTFMSIQEARLVLVSNTIKNNNDNNNNTNEDDAVHLC